MWIPLASAALAFAPPAPGEPLPAHNVLVIVMDDVGCDLVGAYDAYFASRGRAPGTPAATPAIDTLLASRGLMFANAWTSPTCSPSRARLLTGRYGFRTGIGAVLKDNPPTPQRNPGLQANEVLLPELLHQAPTPYTCAGVGKWHLVDIDQFLSEPTHPLGLPPGRWFDRYAGSMFNLTQAVPGSSQNIYFSWIKSYASLLEPGVNPCASGQPPCDVAVVAPPVTHYATVDTTEDALRMIQVLPEPWFLYVSYNAAHIPGHVIPSGLPQVACGPYLPSPSPCDAGNPSDTASRIRCVVAELDNQIGRLLCSVDDNDTTVMLFGDNGSDRHVIQPPLDPTHGKGSLYEDGVRVPLIIRSPLQAAGTVGTVSTVIVSSTDVFATVAKIAGVPPSVAMPQDSVSMLPYLHGAQVSRRAQVYAETFQPNFRPDPLTGQPPPNYRCSRHGQALRDQRFKLIRQWRRDHNNPGAITMTEEFYDLTEGGPPDTGHFPPLPTPDWFEANDLLVSGVPPGSRAARALAVLRHELDTNYPPLVQ